MDAQRTRGRKTNRKASRSNPVVQAQFMRDVAEFWLCPVPTEARWRFPEPVFTGSWLRQKEREKAQKRVWAKREAKRKNWRSSQKNSGLMGAWATKRPTTHAVGGSPQENQRGRPSTAAPPVQEMWWPGKRAAASWGRRAKAAAARAESSRTLVAAVLWDFVPWVLSLSRSSLALASKTLRFATPMASVMPA